MKAKAIMEDIARTRANFKKASSRLWDYLEEKNEFRDPLDPLTLGTDGEILLELAHIAARKEMEAKSLADQLIGSLKDERAEMILRLRYMDGMSWALMVRFFEDIDEPVSERHLYRVHAKALERIDALLAEMAAGAGSCPTNNE